MAADRVSTDNLNLRQGPGMAFGVIAQLPLNTELEKTNVSDTGFWFGVKTTQNGVIWKAGFLASVWSR